MTEPSGDAPMADPPSEAGETGSADAAVGEESKGDAGKVQESAGDAQPASSDTPAVPIDGLSAGAGEAAEESTAGDTSKGDVQSATTADDKSKSDPQQSTDAVPATSDAKSDEDVDIFQVDSGWNREEIEEMKDEWRRDEEEEAMALMAGEFDEDDDMTAALEQQAAALANGTDEDNSDMKEVEELQRLIAWQQSQLKSLPGDTPKVDDSAQPFKKPRSAEDWAALRALMSPPGTLASPLPAAPAPALPPPVTPGLQPDPNTGRIMDPSTGFDVVPPQPQGLLLPPPPLEQAPTAKGSGLPPFKAKAGPEQGGMAAFNNGFAPLPKLGAMPMDFSMGNSGPAAAMTPEDILQAAQNHHGLDPNAPPRSKVCIFYLSAHCRHGMQCMNRHPPDAECAMMKAQYKRRPCRFGDGCQMAACLYAHPRDGTAFNGASAMPPAMPFHNMSSMATPPGAPQQRVFMMNH